MKSPSMPTIISQAIYPIPFVILAMTGGTAAILAVMSLAVSWPPTDMSRDHAYLLLKLGIFAVVCIGLALRPRVVRFLPETGDVAVTWGVHLPVAYHTYHAQDWTSLSVAKFTPVAVTPVGGVMRVQHLAERWKLEGVTRAGKTVMLGTFATEKEANDWKSTLTSVAK